MLPLEWLSEARPLRNQLLVRRFEERETFGLIWIPASARAGVRPPFAEIVAVGDAVDPMWEYEVGDVVALNPVAGVRMLFGTRSEQHYLYTVYPTWIICGVSPEQVESYGVRDMGESPFRIQGKDPRESMVAERRRDHGLRKARV